MDKKGINYWIVQVKPKQFRLRDALRADAFKSFEVHSHKERIKMGDRVIVWQTGFESGCYALGEVASEVEEAPIPEIQKAFYLQRSEEMMPRAALNVEYNLWNNPILKHQIPPNSPFEDFNTGLPGVNYSATKAQYDALVQQIKAADMVNEPEVEYQTLPTKTQALNRILYGPPGTGKTYQTVNHALSIIENRTLEELALEERAALRARFNEYQTDGRIAFVSFHPSFAYEEFIEGIKVKTEHGQVVYAVEEGIFKVLCTEAQQAPDQKYVLIIDEINRGNLPAIFGELISLIEPDKRAGQAEALTTILPYSKQRFSVPPNVYLIGTMNTSDRSAQALDIALRRRFEFIPMRVHADLLALQGTALIDGIEMVRLLKTINLRLTHLLGDEFAIGHAYFLGMETFAQLKQVFETAIIPLLESYFFHNYMKIGLVLGAGFVEKVDANKEQHPLLMDFSTHYSEDITEQNRFRLRPSKYWTALSFIRIYEHN